MLKDPEEKHASTHESKKIKFFLYEIYRSNRKCTKEIYGKPSFLPGIGLVPSYA